MVLEIRLENFFSIKDEVSLDFRAAKLKTKEALSLPANIIDYDGQKILKSIGLFGANASGKSNIIKAISFCDQLILKSHQYNEGTIFNFTPFKFEGYTNRPSVFSIDFIHDHVEYEYSFTLTTTEILKESLYFYPNGRRAKVFVRDETKGTDKTKIYSFGDGIIPRPLDVATNTSKKTLFLSRASQMDRDLCKKLYLFFMYDFFWGFVPLNINDLETYFEQKKPELLFTQYKDLILHALSICDSDISGIEISDKKTYFLLPENERKNIKFETYHKAAPNIPFDLFNEESTGTNQLLILLFFLFDVVMNEKTLMLDEFDLSLHTKLADFVIDLFHAGSSAQFFFTSHNTNLIDVKRFRKDQIMFANKKEDGSTELYSLYDYKDFRENMDAEKGYLQGRFDAIPNIDNSVATLKKLLESKETA